MQPQVGKALNKIKESYEDLLSSVVENLAGQLDEMQDETSKALISGQSLEMKNTKLE
jgi:hypothetical protein